jgi:hypothetical protein
MPSPQAAPSAILRQVSESVIDEAGRYQDIFLHAEPFKHVVI